MSGYIVRSSHIFEKDLSRLEKKYPQIRNDIREAFDALQRGSRIDSIPGGKGKLLKLRTRSSDLKRGKSGGFRVVFYLEDPNILWPIICYFKGERENVPLPDLVERAKELGLKM